MTQPKYFLAVLGNPEPPGKDTIESGLYHPDQKYAPFPVHPGDVLLLYCTGSYTEHFMQSPGFGVVLRTDDKSIHYGYFPFSRPVSKDRIEHTFQPNDNDKFKNIRFSSFWLFEISRESFAKAVGEQPIRWL
ncbi:MAG: hypothetical protein HY647_01825 [Acidobacteria bacterium]|nr:hypothetical protein [Acidobacteriota bacterium]